MIWCADGQPITLKQVLTIIWLRLRVFAARLRLRWSKSVLTWHSWPASQRLVFKAGLVLILAGILCLCLSGIVVTGWWQGTLDAFGVGFVVGGLVDVLAVYVLNQNAAAEDQRRQENNREARELLQPHQDIQEQARKAFELVGRSWPLLDDRLRRELMELVLVAGRAPGVPRFRIGPLPGEERGAPEDHQE